MRRLIYYYAEWCGPCKAFARRVISPLEDQFPGQVERRKTADHYSDVKRLGVKSLPAVVVVEDDGTEHLTRERDIERLADVLRGGA